MMTIKNILIAGFLGCAMCATTACQENEYGTVDLSGYIPEPEVKLVYNHPCALYSSTDFERVRTAIANGTLNAAQQEEFDYLKQNRYVIGDYGVTAHTHPLIIRSSDNTENNYTDAMKDAAAAYQFGLLWQLTGNTEYAQKGVMILKAWVKDCTGLSGNNLELAAGAQGFTFALAGEELRTWSGWSESEFTEFKNWMLNVFASQNYKFLMLHRESSCGTAKHYMSNWDLVNLCSYLQIGILTEDDEMVKFVTNYFTKTGDGLGTLPNIQQHTFDFTLPDGTKEKVTQAQESGRDQAHATMAIVVAGHLAQAAWALYENNPTYADLDYFSSNDNALRRMAEYNALANLKTGTHADITTASGKGVQGGEWLYPLASIPFEAAGPWCPNTSHEAGKKQTAFGDKDRGELRPGYEIFYKHYKTDNYFIKKYAEVQRPEHGSGDPRYTQNSGGFDQIGWGTLMLYQE